MLAAPSSRTVLSNKQLCPEVPLSNEHMHLKLRGAIQTSEMRKGSDHRVTRGGSQSVPLLSFIYLLRPK